MRLGPACQVAASLQQLRLRDRHPGASGCWLTRNAGGCWVCVQHRRIFPLRGGCMYVCMHVCMYMHECVFLCTCIRTRIPRFSDMNIHTHTHINTRARTSKHERARTRHSCTHKWTRQNGQTKQINIPSYLCIHQCMTHTHTETMVHSGRLRYAYNGRTRDFNQYWMCFLHRQN